MQAKSQKRYKAASQKVKSRKQREWSGLNKSSVDYDGIIRSFFIRCQYVFHGELLRGLHH